MLRVGTKLPGYYKLQGTNFPRSQLIRFSSKTVCEPARPPQPLPGGGKKKSRFRLYLGAALLVGGTGTLLYAKYDKEFRKSLYSYAPWTEGVIKFVFQEEKSYQESVGGWVGLKTESLSDDAATQGSLEAVLPPKKKERERCEPGADESDFEESPKPLVSSGAFRSVYSIEELNSMRALVEKETDKVVKSYADIKDLLRRHTEEVAKVVEGSAEILDADLRLVYADKFGKLAENYSNLENQIKESKTKINGIRQKIRESKVEGGRDMIDLNKRKIDDCVKIASDASRTIYEERQIKDICDDAFKKLNLNRIRLMEEINALFPNLNIPKRTTVLKEQEVDLFLVYSAMQIDHYRDAVKAIEGSRESRITRAICQVAPDEEERNKIENLVADGLNQRKKEVVAAAKRRIAELKNECERQVAKQLARQTEVHLATLREMEAHRAMQLRAQYSDELEKVVRATKEKNAASLKEMQTELRELDELFRARTDKDFSAHRSQGQWAAANAISRAINQLMPAVPPEDKLVKIDQEIDDIVQASVEGDELIASVVRSLPKDLVKRGIYTNEALVERFDKVAKVALMTSIVPEQGGPLPLYLLSWIQSWFLCKGSDLIPSSVKKSHHSQTAAPLDNHTIIKEARYWLERGDLLQAVKYMNNLKGYSRRVASSWICEVHRHLEAQQAADIIMAHAVAKGML